MSGENQTHSNWRTITLRNQPVAKDTTKYPTVMSSTLKNNVCMVITLSFEKMMKTTFKQGPDCQKQPSFSKAIPTLLSACLMSELTCKGTEHAGQSGGCALPGRSSSSGKESMWKHAIATPSMVE
eukprot:1528142-Amphidinium_carterae.1